jgi:hypothetical protein
MGLVITLGKNIRKPRRQGSDREAEPVTSSAET